MDHKTLISRVSEVSGLEVEESEFALASLIKILENALCEGDSVSIPSFGSFDSRKRNERIMSHPSDPGKRLLVPPKIVVNFKPSAILKSKLNDTASDE